MSFFYFTFFSMMFFISRVVFAQDLTAMKRDFDNSIQHQIEIGISSVLEKSNSSVLVFSTYQNTFSAISKQGNIGLPKLNMPPIQLPTETSVAPLDFASMVTRVQVYIRTKTALSDSEKTSIESIVGPILENFGSFKKEIKFEVLPTIPSNSIKPSEPIDRTWLYVVVVLSCCAGLSLAIYLGSKNFTNNINVQPPPKPDFETPESRFNDSSSTKSDLAADSRLNETPINTPGLNKAAQTRWRKFVELDSKIAAMGLSRWALSQDEQENQMAVYACSLLSLSSIKKLMPLLSTEVKHSLVQKTKMELNEANISQLDQKLLAEINTFVFEENHNELSVESFFVDFTPQEIAMLMKRGNKYSRLLTQHLNPLRLTRAIQLLTPKEVGVLFGAFQDESTQDDRTLAQEARALIIQIRESRPSEKEHPLFKLLQTLKDLNFEQEEQVYSGLIEFGTEELVQSAAVQTFPGFLAERLSLNFLKQAISSFSLNERVEILLCVSEPMKDRIFKSLDSQAKLKDALQSQIYDIKNSPAEFELIFKNKDKIVRGWMLRVQKQIKSSEEFKKESLAIINQWYKEAKDNRKDSSYGKAS